MATIGYAGLPIPAGGDAPDLVAAIAELAAAIDPHLVQPVTDQADRDARLSGAPQHTMAAAADGSTWLKTSSDSNTWATVYAPLPAWQPIALAAGYQSTTNTPQALVLPTGQVHLRGRAQLTSGGLIVGTNGVKIGDVPSGAVPAQLGSFAGGSSLAGDAITAVGRVEVFSPAQSSTLGTAGSIIWWSQDGSQDNGTTGVQWVDISGTYWLN